MRRALVTGAGQRLGRAMALYLGQRGFDVAVHYATSRAGAEATAAEITAMGRRAVALQADLGRYRSRGAVAPRGRGAWRADHLPCEQRLDIRAGRYRERQP